MITNSMKKNTQGFTLVELIIAISIIGILAAFAAPRFTDLTNEARSSMRDGIEGAINSTMGLTHAQSVVDGNQNLSSSTIQIEGQTVSMSYGYPVGGANGIILAMNVNTSDVTILHFGTLATIFSMDPSYSCYLIYIQALGPNNPPYMSKNTCN